MKRGASQQLATTADYTITLSADPSTASVHRKREDSPTGFHPAAAEIVHVTATVAAKTAGANLKDLTVQFSVGGGDAFFYVEGMTADQVHKSCTATTDANGIATAALICEVPEPSYVDSVLELSALDKKLSNEVDITFTGPQPVFSDVTIASSVNAFADGTPRVTIQAEVLEDGEPIDEAEILFRNLGTVAVFSEEVDQDEVVKLAVKGRASVLLQSNKPVADTMILSLENDTSVRKPVIYLFTEMPEVALVLEGNGAPANESSPITAVFTAIGTIGKQPLPGVEVQFSLTGAATFVDASGHVVAEQPPMVTDDKGEARVSFVSKKKNADEDSSQITVVVTGGNPETYRKKANYVFNNAWADVTKITAKFSGVGPATIFKNGLHQARLDLVITLGDKKKQLTDDNSPELAQFLRNVWFTDYYNLTELTWLAFGTEKNDFNAQLYGGRSAVAAINEPDDASLKDGVVRLTYYVSCADTSAMAADIGQRFRPTAGYGPQQDPQSDKDDFYNAAEGKPQLAVPVTLNLLDRISYTQDALQCTPTQGNRNDINDDGITDPGQPAPEANCWRRYDYTFSWTGADATKYGTRVFQARVDAKQFSALDGCCVGYNGDHLYTHAAYFWPMNVRDNDGQPLDDSMARSFPVGEYEVYAHRPGLATFPENFQGIALSVFSYFGYWYDKGRRYSASVNLTLYDEFGNSGKFRISADDMPSRYSDFKSWVAMKGGWPGRSQEMPAVARPSRLETLNYGMPPWSTKLRGTFLKKDQTEPVVQYVVCQRRIANGKPWWFVMGWDAPPPEAPPGAGDRANYLFFPRTDEAPFHEGVQVWVKDAMPPQVGDDAVLLMRDDADNVLGLQFAYFAGATDTWGKVHPIWSRQTLVMQPLRPQGSQYFRTHYAGDSTSEAAALSYVQGEQKFELTPVDYRRESDWTPPPSH